ncbi:CDGSH iron-sulfur domain-containing protein 1-like isoform X2 [Varroa jacobsoni]|uniref:Iron-binding zinc finger CDGSH type domain-containing protein n=1 Tax=Varroa destructor TaxID=109461 RepID=A0A7M7MA22_VARDE|nr:CDGSH iron-sulfur domain-containing protein 1-like isoform X2 [Varroa destructor]XP_022690546.1 CDGSH iron-sulfur domain-containing protein 1-like isoform X2 [Varroa jacobsoni]
MCAKYPYAPAAIATTLVLVGGAVYWFWKKGCWKRCGKNQLNPSIEKNNPKVVHTMDIEDIGDKKVFCRCWRSAKFPYCDGSHNKHNQETGDNVGPLIVEKKK